MVEESKTSKKENIFVKLVKLLKWKTMEIKINAIQFEY